MFFKPLLFSGVLLLHSCNNAATVKNSGKTSAPADKNHYSTIKTIPLPEGFARTAAASSSFAAWLRNIVLKEDKTVHLFNGNEKRNQLAQFAVMNISVGNKDLQQCADAVMRLRAEYLFTHKRFTEIVFYDNNKTAYSFSAPYSREHFMNYLQQVFGMCGSASLSKQLKTKTELTNIQPGDVLIRGGFPGHAVIVTDVATDSSGKKIFMLAQSYMPAQEIHVLNNPVNEKISPWYEVSDTEKIITPEYIFKRNELKSW
jgi:Domain of unknown function (4846)